MPEIDIKERISTEEENNEDTNIGNYISDQDLINYIRGDISNDFSQTSTSIVSTKINGIEGLPYQFMESVDRRIFDTDVGRKYGDRVFSRLPLLFLTPCEPLFMDDFDKSSKNAVVSALLGNTVESITDLINGSGRYYSINFNYVEYYEYLNTMLSCLSVYLDLYETKISIGGRSPQKIGLIDWSKELNDDFKTFFSSQENVIFYLDGLNSVSESFSNETTESSLASTINGFSDAIKEIKFLFGSGGNVAGSLVDSASEVTTSIAQSLSSTMTALGGGIVGSLANNGVNTVLNGGKIVFPDIWSSSSFEKSYSLEIKLRSPDHDNLSIFLNILKPYCKLLCMVLPRQVERDDKGDPNSYSSPLLVKAYSKGMFNIDMGIITGMSVTKGAECCWNDDGLPTQIDISIEIKDLYSHMAMSRFSLGNPLKSVEGVVNNTAYMDFLANMAGLNIAQMEVGRRIEMIYYLSRQAVSTAPSSVFRRFDQGVTKLIGKMYNIF